MPRPSDTNPAVIVVLVQEIMTRRVVTVMPDTSLADARRLLDAQRIRHLPVVREDRLVGVVSDRDLRSAQANRPVREMAKVLLLADRQAEVRPRVAAVDALAALRREQGDDVVADGDRADAHSRSR